MFNLSKVKKNKYNNFLQFIPTQGLLLRLAFLFSTSLRFNVCPGLDPCIFALALILNSPASTVGALGNPCKGLLWLTLKASHRAFTPHF